MTVKKKNRPALFLTVLLLVLCIGSAAHGQKKNVLRIRFQTAAVYPSTTDTTLNVYYKLEVGRPPVNFHGFDCRFIYENTKIGPINMDQQNGYFAGTACANSAFAHGTVVPPDEYRVQVDGTMLDTANPILFEVRYTVKGVADSAMITPTMFDVLSSTSGIDSVIIENASWDPKFLWHSFSLMYADTTKAPPKKKSITLSSDSSDIQSDSVRTVSVNVGSLDSAKLQRAKFEFDLDTAAFDSVNAIKGALLATGSLAVIIAKSHVTAQFSTGDSSKPFTSGGELLKIVLRGRKRTDTVCTGLLNPKLTVLNPDNLVSSVAYLLKGICVYGRRKDTVTKGVAATEEKKELLIFPNPASSFIDFLMPEGLGVTKHLIVFDALGRKVFDSILDAGLRWEVASVPAGMYTATVTNFSALQEGRAGTEKRKILIIH